MDPAPGIGILQRMAEDSIDPKICPFCGRPNGCQAGDPRCWCNDEPVPAGLRAIVPVRSIMKACICRDCVRSYKLDPEAFEKRFQPGS